MTVLWFSLTTAHLAFRVTVWTILAGHCPGLSEGVVGWLDALGAHVDFALSAMVRSVDKHVENHGAAIGVVAAFPGRDVPGALELLGSDFREHRNHIVERLLEEGDSRSLLR